MVVDASVWVAAFLVRDAHGAEVLEFLRRVVAARAEAAIPALALAEIGGAIARRSSAPEPAVAAVDFIRAQDWIEVVSVGVALGVAAARLAKLLERRQDMIFVLDDRLHLDERELAGAAFLRHRQAASLRKFERKAVAADGHKARRNLRYVVHDAS